MLIMRLNEILEDDFWGGGAGEMAPWVKASTTKPGELSSIPETHMGLSSCLLTSPCMLLHTHAHTN